MAHNAEDWTEIFNLLYRYANTIDRHANEGADLQLWLDTLTEDIHHEFHGVINRGYEQLTKLASMVHGQRHIIVNPYIEVAGDTGSIEAVLLCYVGLELKTVAWYDFRVRRTPGGWRFCRIQLTRSTGGLLPTD